MKEQRHEKETLESPKQAGIQLVHLADHGARLEVGRTYDWSVALVVDADRRDLDVVAGAAIRRGPPAPGIDADVAAGMPSHRALAKGGVWYDSIADL